MYLMIPWVLDSSDVWKPYRRALEAHQLADRTKYDSDTRLSASAGFIFSKPRIKASVVPLVPLRYGGNYIAPKGGITATTLIVSAPNCTDI